MIGKSNSFIYLKLHVFFIASAYFHQDYSQTSIKQSPSGRDEPTDCLIEVDHLIENSQNAVYSILSQFPTTVYHIVFDELLKETGQGLRIIVSKYPELLKTGSLYNAIQGI